MYMAIGGFSMAEKPTYKELDDRIKEIENESRNWVLQ